MEISSNSFLLFIGLVGFGILDLSKADFLDEVCMQPVDEGHHCDQARPRLQYYFSTEHEKCLPFMYKGCGGNKNRFAAQDDCTDACQIDWYRKKNKKGGHHSSNETPEAKSPADCKLPMDKGPCRALITQWYFDTKSGTCQTFSYGGCLGNKNRFNSQSQCQNVCMNKTIK